MQQPTQTIRFSNHIKNKLRQHQITPMSLSSDDLPLSDDTDDDNGSPSPEKPHRRRSTTFITYPIRKPSEVESFFTTKSNISKPSSTPRRQQICQECHRREQFLRNEHQRLLQVHEENRKLTEQLRSEVSLKHQYQEENTKLRYYLKKANTHLREYQANIDLLKQKLISEKSKDSTQIDQVKRLQRELQVYNQTVAAKQQEELKEIDYYTNRSRIHRK